MTVLGAAVSFGGSNYGAQPFFGVKTSRSSFFGVNASSAARWRQRSCGSLNYDRDGRGRYGQWLVFCIGCVGERAGFSKEETLAIVGPDPCQ